MVRVPNSWWEVGTSATSYHYRVDLFHFVNERLRFTRYVYDTTVAVFDQMKRKIEAGEEPYIDTRDPEYADEPAFLEEWEDADVATDIIGGTCLGLLQNTFHCFLEEYLKELGGKKLVAVVSMKKKGNWFANYRAVFQEDLGIEWASSGVDLELVEQVILTRNDFSHNVRLSSPYAYQDAQHAKKYPGAAFIDPRWKVFGLGNARLIVPREKLESAIESIRKLCEYLEAERIKLIRRIAAKR